MRHISLLFKLLVASLLLGAGLSALDITPVDILNTFEINEETLKNDIVQMARWAVPHIITGSLIIVPLWIVLSLLLPPKR